MSDKKAKKEVQKAEERIEQLKREALERLERATDA